MEVPKGKKLKKNSSSHGGRVSTGQESMSSNITYDGEVAKDAKNNEAIAERAMKAKRRGEVMSESMEATGRNGSRKGRFKTWELKKVDKDAASTALIRAAFERNPLFHDLTEEQITTLVAAMKPKKCSKNTKIIRQGKTGQHFFIVQKGRFTYQKKGVKEPLGEAKGGDSFGELALLYGSPREVSVVCEESAELWVIDRETFRQIVSRAEENSKASIRSALKNAPILDGLNDDQIEALVDSVHVQAYQQDDVIIQKGSNSRIFYIIKEGEVEVTKAGKNLNTLIFRKGEYFGERALMDDKPRAANVIARTPCECLLLDAENFQRILGDLKDVLTHNFGMHVLKSIPLFKELTNEQHEKIYDVMKIEEFEEGKLIVKQGDLGRKFYIIKEGEVEVLKNENKKTLKVTKLASGDFFGEGALINDDPRAADIIARTKVQCFTIRRQAFEDVFGGSLKEVIEKENVKRSAELNNGKQVFRKENIKYHDLEIYATLGTGTFGRVKLVQDKKSKRTFALKILKKQQIMQYRQQSNVMNEKNVMKDSDHPFILKLYETYKDAEHLYMLLELIQGGELFNLLQVRGGKISNGMARFYTSCVVDAFHYLHERQIVYRDLKPENLMIDTEGYIRVVDFGFAKKVKKKTYTLCGTPEYLAPELVLGKGHNRAVDLWAVGILVYEMIYGSSPFADVVYNDQVTICKKIVKGTYSFPKQFPGDAKSLIKAFLKRDPYQRLGMLRGGSQEIKQHVYFDGLDWDVLRNKKIKAPWVPVIKDALDTSNFEVYDEEEEVDEHYKDDDEGRWDKF